MNKIALCLLLAGAVNGWSAAIKISDLPAADSVGLSDVLPVVVSNQTRKVTVAQLGRTVIGNGGVGNFVGGENNTIATNLDTSIGNAIMGQGSTVDSSSYNSVNGVGNSVVNYSVGNVLAGTGLHLVTSSYNVFRATM